jgi:hypothetical protein
VPGQKSIVWAGVELEQYFYFPAYFVRGLPILEISFPLVRRKIGKLVEETLNLGFQLVVPIRQSRRAQSEEDKRPLVSLVYVIEWRASLSTICCAEPYDAASVPVVESSGVVHRDVVQHLVSHASVLKNVELVERRFAGNSGVGEDWEEATSISFDRPQFGTA